jgi:hypothetical protein
MKKYLVLFCLLVFAFANAQSGAKIVFSVKDNILDFGKISKKTDDGIRVFQFKNEGDAVLVISDIQATSSCAVISKKSEPILPGGSGEIIIRYNMKTGPIRKTIQVETNAVNYDSGRVSLKIIGEVVVGE